MGKEDKVRCFPCVEALYSRAEILNVVGFDRFQNAILLLSHLSPRALRVENPLYRDNYTFAEAVPEVQLVHQSG